MRQLDSRLHQALIASANFAQHSWQVSVMKHSCRGDIARPSIFVEGYCVVSYLHGQMKHQRSLASAVIQWGCTYQLVSSRLTQGLKLWILRSVVTRS